MYNNTVGGQRVILSHYLSYIQLCRIPYFVQYE